MQLISSSRVAAAGDLTRTYFGVYVFKKGPAFTENVTVIPSPEPWVLFAASVWCARPGGLNPEGVKLIIAEAGSDLGRNLDLVEAYQRDHFHLTYIPPGGFAIVPYAIICECATQGLAASDNFNYAVKAGSMADLEYLYQGGETPERRRGRY